MKRKIALLIAGIFAGLIVMLAGVSITLMRGGQTDRSFRKRYMKRMGSCIWKPVRDRMEIILERKVSVMVCTNLRTMGRLGHM